MGVLDNTSVTVDAILTKKGREKLAKGEGQFRITKFALGDDEIDYNLYDVTHPNGSNFYGEAIENMNLLEAVPDQNLSLRFKLGDITTTTGGGGGDVTPILNIAPTNATLRSASPTVTFTPNLTNYTGTATFSRTLSGKFVNRYLRVTSFNSSTGALSINAYNFPSTTQEFSVSISETSGTGLSVNAVIRVLPSGDVEPIRPLQ